ncbi:MAG TPA: aspartate/glutamate racemase family protein [Steroidobacteraceae bacterium]|nr:aspartate/glutamate racemase family protein [Steroidobacteraceae bacterium]
MTPRRICLIHTAPLMVQVFTPLCRDRLPDVKVTQIINESMIKDTIEAGKVRQPTIDAIVAFAEASFKMGTELVMVTCSSIGPAVDLIQDRFPKPVLRVDEPMADAAVAKGRRIGVAATLRTTLEPTSELLLRKAKEAGKEVELVECLCEGAFDAVLAGDTETHDALVSKAMINRLGDVDVIVLAQASMARVADRLPPEAITAPVLSSPGLAMDYIRERLARLRPN